MSAAESRRSVQITRTGDGQFTATNARGGTLTMFADDTDFSPVELLLVALGGCSAIDVDVFTTRRATPERFEVEVSGEKVRDEQGASKLDDVQAKFTVTFPEGEEGDAARAILDEAITRSKERLCTVSRTVEHGTSVTFTRD